MKNKTKSPSTFNPHTSPIETPNQQALHANRTITDPCSALPPEPDQEPRDLQAAGSRVDGPFTHFGNQRKCESSLEDL